MARITWLGEDDGNVPGPSFTTCFDRKFPKGEAVEVTDKDIIARANRNPFFSVEAQAPDDGDEDHPDELKGLTIAELRNLADASGIDHNGLSKSELRDAIRAHDEKSDEQNEG